MMLFLIMFKTGLTDNKYSTIGRWSEEVLWEFPMNQ